jgi:glyoxylase-like metal-dependent hydrolase (beta-lactamase superfamily II)
MSGDVHEGGAVIRTTIGRRLKISSAAIRTTSCSRSHYVWAIVGPHGTFVVDTGFDRAMADKRGRIIVKPIDEGLKTIGIQADAAEDVIVTHLHYDHCVEPRRVPHARYHLQDEEMAYATGLHAPCAHANPFETDDVVAMVRKVFADRVVFHDGADEIAPGVTVHRIGGHSKGLQCIRVMTRRGHVVLAADASHLYAHINEGRVFPVTFNVGDVLEGYRTIKRLAESTDHIGPGHDPLVAEIYPPAAPGLEGLVVRLDVAPTKVG